MAVGRIVRFDDVRGYGFIAPAAGGEDVFVHANDFGEHRHLVRPGMQVEYEVAEGERGLKVSAVRILDAAPPPRVPARQPGEQVAAARGDGDGDDSMCDVLAGREFRAEVTEILIQHVPSLTAAQITQVRERLVDHARSHGWVEA